MIHQMNSDKSHPIHGVAKKQAARRRRQGGEKVEWLFWAKWFLVICAAELFIQVVKDALNFIKYKKKGENDGE